MTRRTTWAGLPVARLQDLLADLTCGGPGLDQEPVYSDDLLRTAISRFWRHPAAEGKNIVVAGDLEPFLLNTYASLLQCVLGDMLLNALEASDAGAAVTLSNGRSTSGIWFSMHNPGAIPPAVRDRVFERGFSTREGGRGLGCYNMRLLAERYLGGRIEFTSDPATGTVFTVTVPVGGP